MARTVLTVTQITDGGVAQPAATNGTADGHKFANDARTFLQLTNNDSSTRSVTIEKGNNYKGHAFSSLVVSLTAAQTKLVGPFDSNVYTIPTGADQGMVYVDFPTGFESQIAVRAYKV